MLNKDDFEKFFREPTKDKLNTLLKNHTGENDNLEFKEKWIEEDKLAKIIISIINSGGGVIIFGIKENKEAKTFENTGLSKEEIKDKTEIMKKLSSYVSNIYYDVRDFDYTNNVYGELQGKFFQMIIIQSDTSKLPLFSLKESNYIKKNEVYIRRGASTEIANNDEIQRILDKTVKARINNFISGDLNEELMQLKVLYSFQKNNMSSYAERAFAGIYSFRNVMEQVENSLFNSKDKFQDELNQLTQAKLARIKKILHLHN